MVKIDNEMKFDQTDHHQECCKSPIVAFDGNSGFFDIYAEGYSGATLLALSREVAAFSVRQSL